MPKRNAIRISKRSVERLTVERGDALFWDRDLTGFGVRVYATGRKVYVAQTRGPTGRSRRVPVGVHGEVAPDEARGKAAAVIDRLARGEDPFPAAPAPPPTMADLAERYVKGHLEVNCRPNTVKTCRRVLDLHILPALGHLPVASVERSHVSELHFNMRDKPAQANQAVEVLSKMFRLAETWGMTPPRRSPCRRVRAYKRVRRERFLTPEEYRRLGRVLDGAEATGGFLPSGIAAIRLLLLTGCRKNEIVTLRWDDIDRTAGEIRIRDAKTGARRVPLTRAVEFVLAGIPRIEGNPWVITGKLPGDHLKNLDQVWLRLRPRAGLDGVRIHDCRHSYASRALAIGEGLPMIGKLLGHRKVTTTARYAHLVRDTEKASARKVGRSIGADILGGDAEEGRAA